MSADTGGSFNVLVNDPADAVLENETEIDLSTELAGVRLPFPVVAASGCSGYGPELSNFYDLAELGAIITKSIMLLPRAGNPAPRMAETPAGMLNSIGLQGPGIDVFLEHHLPWLAERTVCTCVSIAGTSIDEYQELAWRVGESGLAHMIEVNISCPNVANRSQVFALSPAAAADVIAAVRRGAGSRLPVFAKLSADATDIVGVARASVDAGANGLSLINTMLGMAISTRTLRPVLAAKTGGLSGPALKPIALRCVWQVHEALPEIPLIGGGGIFSGRDALEFLLAGASAVSVGTATFSDPDACVRIRDELGAALREREFKRLRDAIGFAHGRTV
jgi:dihydroorotate dehydrogenase (NAD+) catalytic subunit